MKLKNGINKLNPRSQEDEEYQKAEEESNKKLNNIEIELEEIA